MPEPELQMEIHTLAIFNFFAVVFTSTLLAILFSSSYDPSSKDNVSPQMQIARFICALLFHAKFEQEIRTALTNLKFLAFHYNDFELPYFAALICNMQVCQVIIVELINIYNLNLLNNIMDLIYDFVAFACICDFDDSMLISLMSSKMRVFIGHDISFKQFRKSKVHCKLTPIDEQVSQMSSVPEEVNSSDNLNESTNGKLNPDTIHPSIKEAVEDVLGVS